MAFPIRRFIKAVWYSITFRTHEKGDQLLIDNPEVVILIYKNIISKKRNNLILYKKGVERLTIQIEKKKNIHKGQCLDINNIEKMTVRVNNEQKKIITELQKTGMSTDEIEQHPTYLQFYNAENNFQTILEKKYSHHAKLEQDIDKRQKDIELHTNKLTCLQKDLDQLNKELSEMEAERFFNFQQEEFRKIKSRSLEVQHENEGPEMSYELIKENVQEILKEISVKEISIKNSHDRLKELNEKIVRKYID